MYTCIYIYIYIYTVRLGALAATQRQRQAAQNVRLPQTRHFCACRARRGNSQCLAKSSPYAGPSAGAEVPRFTKWHVWCLLADRAPALFGRLQAGGRCGPPFSAPLASMAHAPRPTTPEGLG